MTIKERSSLVLCSSLHTLRYSPFIPVTFKTTVNTENCIKTVVSDFFVCLHVAEWFWSMKQPFASRKQPPFLNIMYGWMLRWPFSALLMPIADSLTRMYDIKAVFSKGHSKPSYVIQLLNSDSGLVWEFPTQSSEWSLFILGTWMIYSPTAVVFTLQICVCVWSWQTWIRSSRNLLYSDRGYFNR